MDQPADDDFDLLEVRFKNGRKDFYKNTPQLSLQMGEAVTVEGSPGHDVGTVSLTGPLVKLQLRHREKDPEDPQIKKIYRKATQRDIDIWQEARSREKDAMIHTRQIVRQLGLDMKISDVEFQGDGQKATFFYTAPGRVDFRELIKILASEFRIRVEMRQIGARQEAGRVGGIGSCGRELCCSTWLTDFRSVLSSAARYQQLALNPQKLAGQCGKLKCCLNYELDMYLEALRDFPNKERVLKTQKGEAYLQKMDIFQRKLWYAYDEHGSEWIVLEAERAKEIIALNEQGRSVQALEDFALNTDSDAESRFQSGLEEDSLTRFDSRNKKKKHKKKGRGRPRPTSGK